MLKISSIEFLDQNERSYTINYNQLESFPLIGGETAETISTRGWNQQGNTFINAFMEPAEGEIIFIIYTADKQPTEIEEARKEIIDICHPLNGQIQMKVMLNSGNVYNRDIHFVSTPIFANDFENRNQVWQKVQLIYEINNPYWYSDNEIVESFVNEIPLFQFPFELKNDTPIVFGNIVANQFAYNTGQVEAPVTIQILNACINPVIINKRTGEFIKFKNLTMYYNDELLIDTTYGKKKVTLNGVNIFNKLDHTSTFFNLSLGANEIEFTDESQVTTTAKINFIYRNYYISI